MHDGHDRHDGHDDDDDRRRDAARRLGRREVLAVSGAAAAGLVLGACSPASAERAPRSPEDRPMTPRSHAERMPVVFLPHGGGPWPFVERPMGEPDALARLSAHLRGIPSLAPRPPRALLVISAHWEERLPTVSTSPRPPMLYDYYGFPPAAYEVRWPAPGDPALAARVRALLGDAGIETAEDAQRGFDHGTFVPLKLAFPDADVPTVQLSLRAGLDPDEHLAIGRALRPLRDDGVLIVGSGMSYHNMRGFRIGGLDPASVAFDDWLRETIGLEPGARDARLARWSDAPSARACHPREEHLLPLMVIAGAAGDDRGRVPYADTLMGARIAAACFG